MFGKKCSLCGGKLNSNNICTECGLDNSKSEKNYRINTGSCDGMPLTHVHEEKQEERKWEKRQNTGRTQSTATWKSTGKASRTMSKPKKKGKKRLAVIIIILFVLIAESDTIMDAVWELVYQVETKLDGLGGTGDYEGDYEAYDPYENLDTVLPSEGETLSYTLENGVYVVGVHLPPGNYTAETVDDFDVVQVDDMENGVWLYEYTGKDTDNYLDDLRLFKGARVTIDGNNPVQFATQNGQTGEMTSVENPLTASVAMTGEETKKAGTDFEAGVYDIQVTGGIGGINVVVYDENGEQCYTNYIFLAENGHTGYNNLVLPENAEISLYSEETEDGDIEVTLTPSEIISPDGYMEYYRY